MKGFAEGSGAGTGVRENSAFGSRCKAFFAWMRGKGPRKKKKIKVSIFFSIIPEICVPEMAMR